MEREGNKNQKALDLFVSLGYFPVSVFVFSFVWAMCWLVIPAICRATDGLGKWGKRIMQIYSLERG